MSNKAFKQKPKFVKAERVKKEKSGRGRRLFASLFNNQAAFDGGRVEPGWIAALLFMVSIVIALVPGMVIIGKTKGSDNLRGNLYHTEVGMVKFAEKLEEEQLDLVVRTENDVNVMTTNGSFADLIATHTYTLSDGFTSAEIPYFAFIQPRETQVRGEDGEVTTEMVDFEYLRVYYTGDIAQSFTVNTTLYSADRYLGYKLNLLKTGGELTNVTSHIIIGREALYTRIYNPNKLYDKNEVGMNFEGRVSSLPAGLNIRDFSKKFLSDNTLIDKTASSYSADVVSNFAYMQDFAYKAVKSQAFWMQTGVYAAIFTLIGAIMGLIIFISTRGKHNPHRDVKFLEAIKIGAWLIPTPALLTLVVGLIMPGYFHMIFIMGLGIRSVWLTMRTLGPQQQ